MKTTMPTRNLQLLSAVLLLWLLPLLGFSQDIDFGKTYFNVTKGVTGGTVEPNDVIEIRATFVVKNGAIADSCAFFDAVPAGTVYIPNTLAILTNEGKIYKTFTDVPGDDCGRIVGSNITINLGFSPPLDAFDRVATAFRRGTVRATHRPSFYGNTCIMVASYRVRITAAYGTVINLGGGSASYRIRGAIVRLVTFNTNRITIFQNYGICPNSVGGNTLGAEFNGTFGTGKFRNRGTSASVPSSYTYRIFDNSSPQDYYYGIANNTSTKSNYTTSNAWPKPDNSSPSHRVFSVWDIIGDHTGAVNPLIGNPAADTVIRNDAGYMLVINASYKTDSAFQHTVTNLCPNTYYEISAWFRNICSKCGCDSTGRGASSAGYIPTATGDSSGVYPSLTFDVNGSDYYSTGQLRYTGQWIKKGFTYRTGPTETSFKLTVKNNAPGGGGNDWAIDDISVATCTPNLDMKPSPSVSVCYGNTVNMYCDVRCYFPNYTYYAWEKSTDGGTNWSATGISGIGTPVLVSGQWQYSAYYPPFTADSGAHNARYRIKIASSAANLTNAGCSYFASSVIQVYVNNCMQLLDIKLTSFNGRNENDHAMLNWTTENETNNNWFEVERSTDGVHFSSIANAASNASAAGSGRYAYSDPDLIEGSYYYRIKATDGEGYKYSRVVAISSSKIGFQLKSLINPFQSNLSFDIQAPSNAKATVLLFDNYGRVMRQKEVQLATGVNKVILNQLEQLPPGGYILRISSNGKVINERVIKATKK
jgi:hypothetical protein